MALLSETPSRWNFETRQYEPHQFPESWNTPLWTTDYEQIANCAECGNELPYGKTFTSLRIHNSVGLGFGVCNDCYSREWDARKAAEAARG